VGRPHPIHEGKTFEQRVDAKELSMPLKIAWRNLLPVIRTKRTLQRTRRDQFGAVYAVTVQDLTQEFEVLLGEVA
jgi:hypothetical protein